VAWQQPFLPPGSDRSDAPVIDARASKIAEKNCGLGHLQQSKAAMSPRLRRHLADAFIDRSNEV
jgi:hypothetical protein